MLPHTYSNSIRIARGAYQSTARPFHAYDDTVINTRTYPHLTAMLPHVYSNSIGATGVHTIHFAQFEIRPI